TGTRPWLPCLICQSTKAQNASSSIAPLRIGVIRAGNEPLNMQLPPTDPRPTTVGLGASFGDRRWRKIDASPTCGKRWHRPPGGIGASGRHNRADGHNSSPLLRLVDVTGRARPAAPPRCGIRDATAQSSNRTNDAMIARNSGHIMTMRHNIQVKSILRGPALRLALCAGVAAATSSALLAYPSAPPIARDSGDIIEVAAARSASPAQVQEAI